MKEIECWKQWLILGELKSHNLQRIFPFHWWSVRRHVHLRTCPQTHEQARSVQRGYKALARCRRVWLNCDTFVIQCFSFGNGEGWHKSTSSTSELHPLCSWHLSSQEMAFFLEALRYPAWASRIKTAPITSTGLSRPWANFSHNNNTEAITQQFKHKIKTKLQPHIQTISVFSSPEQVSGTRMDDNI